MVRFDLLYVDRIKFKLALAKQWALAIFFFSKNCANTETQSFADIYAIRILDKGNNHSLQALL